MENSACFSVLAGAAGRLPAGQVNIQRAVLLLPHQWYMGWAVPCGFRRSFTAALPDPSAAAVAVGSPAITASGSIRDVVSRLVLF